MKYLRLSYVCNRLFSSSVGFYVFMQDKNRTSESFLICAISAGIWQAGIGAMYLMNNAALIIPFYKVFTFFGVVNIVPSIYFLTVTSLGLFAAKKENCRDQLRDCPVFLPGKPDDRQDG